MDIYKKMGSVIAAHNYFAFIKFFTIAVIKSSCSSSSFFRSIISCRSFSGLSFSTSKKSLGEICRYSHMKKKTDIDGRAFPHSILLIYPVFCPIDRLISLEDTPFLVRSFASLVGKSSSYIISPSPVIFYPMEYGNLQEQIRHLY